MILKVLNLLRLHLKLNKKKIDTITRSDINFSRIAIATRILIFEAKVQISSIGH